MIFFVNSLFSTTSILIRVQNSSQRLQSKFANCYKLKKYNNLQSNGFIKRFNCAFNYYKFWSPMQKCILSNEKIMSTKSVKHITQVFEPILVTPFFLKFGESHTYQ